MRQTFTAPHVLTGMYYSWRLTVDSTQHNSTLYLVESKKRYIHRPQEAAHSPPAYNLSTRSNCTTVHTTAIGPSSHPEVNEPLHSIPHSPKVCYLASPYLYVCLWVCHRHVHRSLRREPGERACRPQVPTVVCSHIGSYCREHGRHGEG